MSYIIETDKLELRKLSMDDCNALHIILSDSETIQYYPKPFDAFENTIYEEIFCYKK